MLITRYFSIFILLLLCPAHSYAAQEKENKEFTEIKQLKDLIPFAGKVVAFKGGLLPHYYYSLDTNSQISAGYVWLRSQFIVTATKYVDATEFSLEPLFRKDRVYHGCILEEEDLKKNKLTMRLATEKEKKAIDEARKSGKARFGLDDVLMPSSIYKEKTIQNRPTN